MSQSDPNLAEGTSLQNPIAGLYGGGSLYGGVKNIQNTPPYTLSKQRMESVLSQVASSGFNRVVLWSLMVLDSEPKEPPSSSPFAKGDIYMYAHLVSSASGSSLYVGPDYWNTLLTDLKANGTVDQILFCLGGGWEYLNANVAEMQSGGTIYNNFQALRKALPCIDGIDFDFEGISGVNMNFPDSYVDTVVSFASMLQDIGFPQVTF